MALDPASPQLKPCYGRQGYAQRLKPTPEPYPKNKISMLTRAFFWGSYYDDGDPYFEPSNSRPQGNPAPLEGQLEKASVVAAALFCRPLAKSRSLRLTSTPTIMSSEHGGKRS